MRYASCPIEEHRTLTSGRTGMCPVPGIPLEELQLGARLAAQLPFFLRRPMSGHDARTVLASRFQQREHRFLKLVHRTVYASPASPYHTLLRWAGCEAGDLEKLVDQNGVEGTLEVLYQQGVYLTVDEFKGRCPVVRGSNRLAIHPHQLLNPAASSHLRIRTSGSRGPGTLVPIDLAYVRSRSANALLELIAREGVSWRHAIWGIPGGSALVHLLEFSGFGALPVRWFSLVDPASPGLHPRYRWSAVLLRWASVLAGKPLPRLHHASANDSQLVLSWIVDVIRSGETPHLFTYVSAAVRLCEAAREAGVELPGMQFTVTGEPVTQTRLDAVRRTGAQAVPRYGSAESGTIGYGCLQAEGADDVHLLHDRLALLQAEGEIEHQGIPAGALFVTTLEPRTPYMLLNVSLGDQAVMKRRSCGCPLEEVGWTTHLHSVRSFEKLTGAGMSFLETDLIRILEETLPKRFGGGPTHYQLLEEQDGRSLAHYRLLVHPEVGPVDPKEVAGTFFEAIGPGRGIERIMGTVWREAGSLTVERRPPLATRSGKILSVHTQEINRG